MLYERGPLDLIDVERVLPPRLTFGFEALAAGVTGDLAGVDARLASHAATMSQDLASSPAASLDGPLARAMAEHAGQVNAGPMSLTGDVYGAYVLEQELAFVQQNFPPEGTIPPVPDIEAGHGGVFLPGDWPAPPAPLPPGGSGGGSSGGDGGGSNGGGGGGGAASPAAALLELYAQQNPSEAARIAAFRASNPGDEARAPAALGLPGWAEFVARNS